MIVVSDTTPIISLMKAGHLNLLKKMFGIVAIPNAVHEELMASARYKNEILEISQCDFLQVVDVSNKKSVDILRNVAGLDAGESEAIIIFDEMKAALLLMDEHKGRQVAKKMGIAITGTVGILLQAYDEGLLSADEITECVFRLKEANVRISDSLYKLIYKHIKK